jgi:hypothetical protein
MLLFFVHIISHGSHAQETAKEYATYRIGGPKSKLTASPGATYTAPP